MSQDPETKLQPQYRARYVQAMEFLRKSTEKRNNKFIWCPLCASPMKVQDTIESSSTTPVQRKRCTSSTCDYIHYNNPTPVACAIVEMPGGVVMVRNKGSSWWGLVTGFLEASDASPEEGVLREVSEELGLDSCEIVKLVGVHSFTPMNQLLITYHIRPLSPSTAQIKLNLDELDEFKIVPFSEVKSWPFGNGLALESFLNQKKKEGGTATRGTKTTGLASKL